MAFAREIFIQIKNVIRFQQSEKEADSHYTVLGNTLVRVSNHCTYMYVWENYFNIHPKQRGMKILSLVFEDNKDTFHPNCLVTQHNNPKPIVVEEYVYPLHGNAQYLSKVDVNAIIKSLQNLGGTNRFHEPTGKAERYVRKSMNPTTQNIITDTNGIPTFSSEFGYGADDVSESSTRKNMKKNTIKLNESQLKKIVAESVKRVLKEFIEDDSISSAHNDADKFINKEELASEFTDWALNDSDKYRGLGGPVNVLQAMHDYYYNDEEDDLYRACENFAEMKGLDVNEVFEAACMACNYYFAYNPDEEDEI